MNKDELIRVIEFWQQSARQKHLHSRAAVVDIDTVSPEIVDLVGPRRSGKSSILKLLIQKLGLTDEYLFINFEDPFFIENNQASVIEQLVDVYREHFSKTLKYIFLDEVQEIQGWERAVRKLRDGTDYKVFITGSSSKLLSGELASALTGRHRSYSIFPLSFREYLTWRGVGADTPKDVAVSETQIAKLWQEFIKSGGFPEAVLQHSRELLQEYFFDIIERDVIARYNIREQSELQRMAVYMLTNATKLVSIASLKKAFGLSYRSVSTYLDYLTDAFLVFPLPQFSYSLKTQQKSLKKWYAVDTGMANAVAVRFSEDSGRQLENTVYIELMRHDNDLYYYKTKTKREVDFVVVADQQVQQLIQVAWSIEDEKTRKRELTALFDAMKELNIDKGMLLTNSAETENVREGSRQVSIMPAYRWALQQEVG
ncbi:MAG: ATP-binding protein [Candidatus Andersenbacteria bacterium]